MFSRGLLCVAAILLCFTSARAQEVKLTQSDNKVRVEIGGKLFTEYYFKDVPRPYCYPLLGPGDVAVTRDWPMKDSPGEDHDHPHHRSLWFAHGDVNGVDFWSEEKQFGKQVHQKFIEVKSGKTGILKTANDWISPDGKVICSDERTLTFHNSTNPKILDFNVTIKASNGDVVLGDTKEGTMAIRLAETMRLAPNKFNKDKPTGHIIQDTGVRDGDTWGKRARWCDYYGSVNGKTMGVAIFDHPNNPRHPTWWHVRDYGLFAANPFGVHYFEKKEAHEGDLKIAAGQSVTFRYRIILHEGDEKVAKISDLYKDYK